MWQERQNTSTIRYQGLDASGPDVIAGSPTPSQVQPGPDYVQQLEQLAKLRDNGILSEEEFISKADILRRR